MIVNPNKTPEPPQLQHSSLPFSQGFFSSFKQLPHRTFVGPCFPHRFSSSCFHLQVSVPTQPLGAVEKQRLNGKSLNINLNWNLSNKETKILLIR